MTAIRSIPGDDPRAALDAAVLDYITKWGASRRADLESGIRMDVLRDSRDLGPCLARLRRRGLIRYSYGAGRSGWVLLPKKARKQA